MQPRRGSGRADHWLDLGEAAEHVGLTREQIAHAVSEGDLMAIRTHPRRPGEWLILRSHLERWLEDRLSV